MAVYETSIGQLANTQCRLPAFRSKTKHGSIIMIKIRAIRRVSCSFLIAATALCAGGAFAQSLQDDASAYADSISAAALPTVKWTAPVAYDTGIKPKVAIRNGLIVEVHKSQSSFSDAIWYHIGKLDRNGGTVTWGPSRKLGDEGDWPAVALSTEGYVVFTWSTLFTNDTSCSPTAWGRSTLMGTSIRPSTSRQI
jgi:hypothetical protein